MATPIEELLALLADPAFHLEGRGPDDALIESMRAYGWLKDLPALRWRGQIVVGHRRMAAADKLGIPHVVQDLSTFMPEEDVIKLALGSNEGGAAPTAAQRSRVARLLYDERGWSQARVAKALEVSQSQVQRDLAALPVAGNAAARKDSLGRKASPGRPRGKASKLSTVVDLKREREELHSQLEHDPDSRTPENYRKRDRVNSEIASREAGAEWVAAASEPRAVEDEPSIVARVVRALCDATAVVEQMVEQDELPNGLAEIGQAYKGFQAAIERALSKHLRVPKQV